MIGETSFRNDATSHFEMRRGFLFDMMMTIYSRWGWFLLWNDKGFLTLCCVSKRQSFSLSFRTDSVHGQGHHFKQINHKIKDRTFLARKGTFKTTGTPPKNSQNFIISKGQTIFKVFYIEVHLEASIIIENDLQQIYSRYHNCLKRYSFNNVRFQT